MEYKTGLSLLTVLMKGFEPIVPISHPKLTLVLMVLLDAVSGRAYGLPGQGLELNPCEVWGQRWSFNAKVQNRPAYYVYTS